MKTKKLKWTKFIAFILMILNTIILFILSVVKLTIFLLTKHIVFGIFFTGSLAFLIIFMCAKGLEIIIKGLSLENNKNNRQ